MSATNPDARFTLRDLPLPAKLVVSCFLLAVGLGYTSAAVQLHFADSKSGKAMPTVEDVVLKFTGKKWLTSAPPRPKSRLEELISGPREGELTKQNMTPAFFNQDGGRFNTLMKGRAVDHVAQTRAEREGEQAAVIAWIQAQPEEQQRAYEEDRFAITGDLAGKPITREFVHEEKPVRVVRIKALLTERCVRCHAPNEQMSKIPLNTLDGLREYMHAPPAVTVPEGGGWVQVTQPIPLADLTRSTHAHLLSFAVLFSLTGLVFAYTSYPTGVRCILGPWVVIALVTDVSFWWLARMCTNMGPYFAMGVMATGAAAGMGLGAQITLSLWNMYGPRGKLVVGGLFVLGGAIGVLVYVNQLKPGLDAKQAAAEGKKATKVNGGEKNGGNNGTNGNDKKVEPVGESRLEKLLRFPVKGPDGKDLPTSGLPFKGDEPGGMVRAFFDRDGGDYKEAMNDTELAPAAKDKLTAERHAELAVVLAWRKLPDAERQKAYAGNALDLPPELAGKPLTAAYVEGSKVKVKSLLDARCARCHAVDAGVDAKAEKFPLDTYEGFRDYLDPKAAGAAPIPAAKE